MQRFHQFAAADLQLFAQQFFRVVHRSLQHLRDGEETRFTVVDDAAVRRDGHFAVGAGIEGIDGLVGAGTRHQMDEDFDTGGRHVFHFTHFDFPFLGGFQDAVDELAGLLRRTRCLTEGDFRDGQRLGIAFLYLGAYAYTAASLPVVILRDIDAAACRKVGIQLERFIMQVSDGGIAQFVQVMR